MCASHSSSSSSAFRCPFVQVLTLGVTGAAAYYLYRWSYPPPPASPPSSDEEASPLSEFSPLSAPGVRPLQVSLSPASSLDPQSSALVASIDSDLEDHKFQEALTKCEESLKRGADAAAFSATLFLLRSRAQLGLHRYSEALESARASAQLIQSPAAQMRIGESLHGLHRWHEAIEAFEVIDLDSLSEDDRYTVTVLMEDAKAVAADEENRAAHMSQSQERIDSASRSLSSSVPPPPSVDPLSVSSSVFRSFFDSYLITRQQEGEEKRGWRNNNPAPAVPSPSSSELLAASVGHLENLASSNSSLGSHSDSESFTREPTDQQDIDDQEDGDGESQQFDPDSAEAQHEQLNAPSPTDLSLVMVERPSERSIAEMERLNSPPPKQ